MPTITANFVLYHNLGMFLMICYLNVHVCICVHVLVRPHGVYAWYILYTT
jgi:hypothetical protein